MYGFPSQTPHEVQEDVHKIASLNSEHLSLYTLTIEVNSRFHINATKLDDDEKLAEHYVLVKDILSQYEFGQYEISNFSKKGFQSQHNKNYWIGDGYLGFGMGAHGFLDNRRYWNKSKLQDYLNDSAAIEGFEELSNETLIIEKVLFGLRMNEGVLASLVPHNKQQIVDELIAEGFLKLEENRLIVCDKGRLVLDELSVRLI
jgi:oxygen-independent coproporphyrinogen-3 oxidase